MRYEERKPRAGTELHCEVHEGPLRLREGGWTCLGFDGEGCRQPGTREGIPEEAAGRLLRGETYWPGVDVVLVASLQLFLLRWQRKEDGNEEALVFEAVTEAVVQPVSREDAIVWAWMNGLAGTQPRAVTDEHGVVRARCLGGRGWRLMWPLDDDGQPDESREILLITTPGMTPMITEEGQ